MFFFVFYNVSLLNVNKSFNSPSIKKLYTIYSFFKNNQITKNLNNNFLGFFIDLNFSLNTTNKTIKSLFLSLLFFNKTFDVLFLSNLSSSTPNLKKFNIFSSTGANGLNSSNLDFFWKKWKNLKRPVSNTTLNLFYLEDFKKKLTTYSKLGFIKTYNVYVILRTKTETFNNMLVSFTKPLLNSPKYSSSSLNKYLSLTSLNSFEFQFLRKNRVYNKGRYSRTRQNYRTGVYMCMYLSVVSIFGLYYWFYKFSFNFTYIWWFFIAFVASFFVPKIFKYRLYEPTTLLSKFFDLFRWFFLLLKSFFN